MASSSPTPRAYAKSAASACETGWGGESCACGRRQHIQVGLSSRCPKSGEEAKPRQGDASSIESPSTRGPPTHTAPGGRAEVVACWGYPKRSCSDETVKGRGGISDGASPRRSA